MELWGVFELAPVLDLLGGGQSMAEHGPLPLHSVTLSISAPVLLEPMVI